MLPDLNHSGVFIIEPRVVGDQHRTTPSSILPSKPPF